MAANVTPAQRELMDLLANSLFGAGRDTNIRDPVAFWREAEAQGVFLIALHNVDIDDFPPTLRDKIHEHTAKFMLSNLNLSLQHAAVTALLDKAEIPHALIKGHACAVWYPVPELRQLGDVDFLVAPIDAGRADAALEAAGFTAETKTHRIHHVYTKNGVRYELHLDIPGVPEGALGEKCRAYLQGLLPEARLRRTPFGDMRLPSVFYHGLVLLLHTAHHLTNSGIGLRQLCDWAVFADTVPEGEFESLFGGPLRELGLWRFACTLTDIAVRWLGAAPKSWAAQTDPAVGDALLEDILSGGNFGQKSAVRGHQAYLITAGRKSRSRLRRVFRLLLDMIYQKWPASKKLKFLIPFGWGFYGLRYLFRAATGKRAKLHVRAALRGAEARTGLYDRLGLFEPN